MKLERVRLAGMLAGKMTLQVTLLLAAEWTVLTFELRILAALSPLVLVQIVAVLVVTATALADVGSCIPPSS